MKARQDLLDRALYIVKLDGTRRMEGALLGQATGNAEGQRGPLFHFLGSAAEDGAQFEQAHIAHIAMEIARNHGQHSRHQRGAQNARFLAEWITKRNGKAGLRRGKSGIGRGTESAADGFVKSGGEQGAAHGGFALGPGQRTDALAEGRQRIGEAIVAIDARDFLDEIDLTFQVEPPTGKRDLPSRMDRLDKATSQPR